MYFKRYLCEDSFEYITNFNDHLLRNLMAIHIKKCKAETTCRHSAQQFNSNLYMKISMLEMLEYINLKYEKK